MLDALSAGALEVSLRFRYWSGQSRDRRAAKHTLKVANAASNAGHFTKHLVDRDRYMKAMTQAFNAVRAAFNRETLPFGDGRGIIPNARFFEFRSAMRPLIEEAEAEHSRFLKVYERLREEAPSYLGRLYDGSKYPPVDEMRWGKRFGIWIKFHPIAPKSLFVETVRETIGDDYEQQIVEDFQDAQRDLWQRIADNLEHYATALGSDKKFWDRTVTKLSDLADLLPRMSLVPDAKLVDVCQRIKKLGSVSPDTLREDAKIRTMAAHRARRTLKDVEDVLHGRETTT